LAEPLFTRFTPRSIPNQSIARICFPALLPTFPEGRRESGVRTERSHAGRMIRFTPGQLFAVLWWDRPSDGEDTQWRSVAVMRALGPGLGGGEVMPGVTPAVEVLGHVAQAGPPGYDGPVDRLLDGIQTMAEAGIVPAERPAAFWREAVRDVLLGRQPRWELVSVPVGRAAIDQGRT
jgi:hypothetical protein